MNITNGIKPGSGIGGVGGGLPGPEGGTGAAKPSSVEKFNDLMAAGNQAPEDPAQAVPPVQDEPGGIMGKINNLNDRLDSAAKEVVSVIESENVTQADLIKANFAMLESSTLISAASKVTEKVTQGVKNLQQG